MLILKIIRYLSCLITAQKKQNSNAHDWYIEFKGEIIGELRSPQYEDMFWDSYTVIPHSQEAAVILFDANYWNLLVFKFKNKATLKYAENAIHSILVENQLKTRNISMRGMY